MTLGQVFTKRLVALAATAALGLFGATAANATNEQYQVTAKSCSPYAANGCAFFTSLSAGAVNIGGGYGFASGYKGGYALASAGFQPGAPSLLQQGQYQQSAIGYMTYSFQVLGTPDTLVPLHMIGSVSVSAIHLSDASGNGVTLQDGPVDGRAPSDEFKIVGSASVQVSASRRTIYPSSGASASVTAIYDPSGFGDYCSNCGGAGDSFDTTVWVYSDSDINVTLNTSALVQYQADGTAAGAVFGSVEAETDPIFSIDDPAFSGFTISGVPTGSPPTAGGVPEPASWAMMVAGFGMAGAMLRKRRRQASALAA
jgi:hypothetical protein